jgi:alanine dehydrogenase
VIVICEINKIISICLYNSYILIIFAFVLKTGAMNDTKKRFTPQVCEIPELVMNNSSNFSIGLLANDHDSDETRLFLTPEGCGVLTSCKLDVMMETDAASSISYPDSRYADYGVKIVTRAEALKADFVLSYSPLPVNDILQMKTGAKLLCMFNSMLFEMPIINALNECQICTIALDNVISHNDVPVFSNIIDEVDGRASIWYAQEAHSFLGEGKGVLLAGVAGIPPLEVLIIGQGSRVHFAAKAAIAAGATVTLMDNDLSALQLAQMECGDRLNTCAIHPRVLTSRVKSADVLILDSCTLPFNLPSQLKAAMKSDIFFLDFDKSSPSLYFPRTVTMALSTCLVNLFNEVILKEGFEDALALSPGLQAGVVTYNGRLTNKLISSLTGISCADINMFFSEPN